MAIQSDETLVTKGNLKELYQDKILPYLGGNAMLATNVSDYYSTDEKIIGVWTDGKPIYQRTVTGTFCSTLLDWGAFDHGITNIEKIIDYSGYILSDNGNYFHLDGIINTAPTMWFTFVSPTQVCTYGNYDRCIDRPMVVTIQYTKSTDAANSAAATPGCYDINRPDLWPNGQEIFFGNGLYGMRKAGTTAANNIQAGITLVSNVSKTACCYNKGGMVDMSGTNGTNWYDINGGWDNKGAQRQFNPLITNTNQTFRFYCQDNQNYTTQNVQYNIWFTYTK